MRVTEQIFLKFGRSQDARQFVPSLLLELGDFGRVGGFSRLALRIQISLQAVLCMGCNIFHLLLHFRGECAQHFAVQSNSGTGRAGEIREIARLPIGSKQPGEQRAALLIKFAPFFDGRLDDVRIGIAAPPLLTRSQNFRGAPFCIECVNLRDNDVPNRLLGAADAPQVADIGGIVRGFNLRPIEILAANDDVRLD